MAKGQPLQQQAAGYANAAVPTVGSINSQYNQSLGDVHGFTNALVQLLQKGGGADPYQGAVNSQAAANQAAVSRLTNLGSPYAAGSAAAVGGMGDSALGSLNAQRGAAIQYQRQLPGIAAARGELANSSLLSQQHTALQQRGQQYQSAYMQALQQLRDYGLQKQQVAQAGQQIRIQQSQFAQNLAQQQRQFASDNAFRYASLNQSQQQFLIHEHDLLTSGGAGGATPAQVAAWHQTGAAAVQNSITGGVPVGKAIQLLSRSQGIPLNIARAIALTEYGAATPPDRTDSIYYNKNGKFIASLFQDHLRKFQIDKRSLQAYLGKGPTTQTHNHTPLHPGGGQNPPPKPKRRANPAPRNKKGPAGSGGTTNRYGNF